MPTTYAHWRFGADCIKTMPDNLQKIVKEHRDCFDLGVHGPDIFFYDILHANVVKYGSDLHGLAVKPFFEECKKTLKNVEDKDACLTYILGFLCHFTLDSTCHGYIDRKKEVSGVSHNLIEAQWDRHIMLLDGRIPNLVDRAESLKPNAQNAKVIANFHPFDEKAILRTTKAQKNIISALNCMYQIKEKILKLCLRKIGMNDFADLFVGFIEENDCRDSNLRLDKLRKKALTLYPKLTKNLLAYFDDKEKLKKYFEHDFTPWQDYKEIPILNYEDELVYKV